MENFGRSLLALEVIPNGWTGVKRNPDNWWSAHCRSKDVSEGPMSKVSALFPKMEMTSNLQCFHDTLEYDSERRSSPRPQLGPCSSASHLRTTFRPFGRHIHRLQAILHNNTHFLPERCSPHRAPLFPHRRGCHCPVPAPATPPYLRKWFSSYC